MIPHAGTDDGGADRASGAPSGAPSERGSGAPGDSAGAGRAQALEVDVDRGVLVGVVVGLAMFFTFQAAILGLFQSGVIGDDVGVWQPLRFAGITQFIYVMPSTLLFVNRKTPRMALGFLVVAGVVFVGAGLALIFG